MTTANTATISRIMKMFVMERPTLLSHFSPLLLALQKQRAAFTLSSYMQMPCPLQILPAALGKHSIHYISDMHLPLGQPYHSGSHQQPQASARCSSSGRRTCCTYRTSSRSNHRCRSPGSLQQWGPNSLGLKTRRQLSPKRCRK